MKPILSEKGTLTARAILPWLHFSSTLPLFLAFALFTAVHSELGRHIAPGESPAFAWVRDNIGLCLGAVLMGRVLTGALQYSQVRQSISRPDRWLHRALLTELVGMAAVVGTAFFQVAKYVPVVHTLYLIAVLAQGAGALKPSGFVQAFGKKTACLRFTRPTPWYFVWLFLLGGLLAIIEPSWRRMTDHILLDTPWEQALQVTLPAWISGAVTLWIGIALVGGLLGLIGLQRRLTSPPVTPTRLLWLAFIGIPALFSALLLAALWSAVAWQVAALNLKAAGLQLFLILGVAGGALLALVFTRIVQGYAQVRQADPITIVCLTLGAALVWPLIWLLPGRRMGRASLRLLAAAIGTACLLGGMLVLFGNLFDPWYTVFSYLKTAVLKLLCIIAAGAAVVLFKTQRVSAPAATPRGPLMYILLLVLAGLVSLAPFWQLGRYPEVKATLLQYNELVRVDADLTRLTFAGIGLDPRLHLGQDPPPNGIPDPWPLPWELHKTHASLLPADFNVLVIVVDALRGDAFASAGYPRPTTPFLDHWALGETISFRRAYSQGGGSFAAFPFLVGGRNPFALYGPQLYRRNLYLKLARAEKIDNLWVTGRFGPRAIFPPGFPVKTLEVDRPVSDRHTPTTDEAFQALDRAMDQLPPDGRFMCFLHLMDVHNDLWKKRQGIDFGNRPRDIYDNNLSYLDGACQRFIGRLKSKGLYARTVILFTADHGEQFWEHGASLHGHTLYEEEIRVPLILLTHGLVKRFEEVPVLNSDMAPTLVDLAGYAVDPPYGDAHMGVSLRPLILNGDSAPFLHRTVAGRASFKRRYLWYRNWEWKLVYFAELDVLQLFNVVRDPLEQRNLLQEQPAVAAEMESELLGYLQQVEGRTYLPVMSRRVR